LRAATAWTKKTIYSSIIQQRYEVVYDLLDRVIQSLKGTTTMSFVYDAAGNRAQRIDYDDAITNFYDEI
jgi:YD repeat-containing protein